jgi:hypothetical protein
VLLQPQPVPHREQLLPVAIEANPQSQQTYAIDRVAIGTGNTKYLLTAKYEFEPLMMHANRNLSRIEIVTNTN